VECRLQCCESWEPSGRVAAALAKRVDKQLGWVIWAPSSQGKAVLAAQALASSSLDLAQVLQSYFPSVPAVAPRTATTADTHAEVMTRSQPIKTDDGAAGATTNASARPRSACDVTSAPFDAVGDGTHDDTAALRSALEKCDSVLLPQGKSFLTGPLNISSNQVLVVDGTLLASTNVDDYPLVAPLMSYGWSIDSNCFPYGTEIVPGALNYQAIINSWNASNVTVTGSGVIDGQGQPWWERCTKCHYPPPVGEWPHANASCLEAGRPYVCKHAINAY
jgi:polygalacturonase